MALANEEARAIASTTGGVTRETANEPRISQSPRLTAPAGKTEVPAHSMPTEPLPANIDQHVDADDGNDADSRYESSVGSETSQLSAPFTEDMLRTGASIRLSKEDGYFMPVDEQQFETLENGHIHFKILDSQEENPLFRSPLSETARNVLDVGTGDGSWATDVADSFPWINVRGVDLFPPPHNYLPPNLSLELDDVTETP